jgi:ribosomal protein RSM22 (predicted rRNA methylase)
MRQRTSHAGSGPKAVAKDVLRLSRLLTKDRDDLPASYLSDRGLRDAYLLYFLPANLAKVQLPLRELDRHPSGLLDRERLRVLDLGSGPGTSVLGVLDFFSRRERRPALDFMAVDQVVENLREAEQLFRRDKASYGGNAHLHTIRSGITARLCEGEGTFDIIILSNVLNELFPGEAERISRRVELVGALLGRLLAEDGSSIIIEPALRETSRELLMVRDGLLERSFTVYAPCLMQETCPALLDPKDWCHEEMPWDAPETVQEIDRLIGLRKDALKFSYTVLRKDGRSLVDVCGNEAFRVVSEPLISKGKRELYICGGGGRRIVMRQDKDRFSSNAAFDGLRRGSVARFEGLAGDDKRLRVVAETRITVLSLPGGDEEKP